MCQRKDCKYIEIKTDMIEKKKWYIHYRIEGKFLLKELYREEVEYEEPTESDASSDSDDGYPKKRKDIQVICKVPLTGVPK